MEAAIASISFLMPWAFALLPLPLLVRLLLPAAQQRQSVALIPFATEFSDAATTVQDKSGKIRLAVAALVWLLIVIAAARPQWHGDAVELPVSGRDLMLAIDISGSMQTRDFELSGQAVDRLTATKAVANDFIRQRQGDRIGLILFGSQAYVQTPLTFDRDTVRILLNEAVIGLAGQETAIGDAIGLAVKRLEQGQTAESVDGRQGDQVLILLTDGVNTTGEVSPQQAAELAAARGLTIYAIGIGADAMMMRSIFGRRRVNPSAQLDEKGLTAIAEKTGGKYFRAHDTEELAKIYRIIDQLEPVEREKDLFRPRHALFMWPLALAVLLAAVLMASMTSWRNPP